MALVSSIKSGQVTNDYNDGARGLKNYLRYAEALSTGDLAAGRRVLREANPAGPGAEQEPAPSAFTSSTATIKSLKKFLLRCSPHLSRSSRIPSRSSAFL